ncbi:malate dehydrogenase [Pasteuria penetrans]|uniref:malate dehydrogenase n=1 Tax=Pasteuria penetrans TaxID=86005 RepID=UPI000F9E6EBE|nr:malate dehydrogenase [Pasteuria penetrans]
MACSRRKIAVVGAGATGTTTALLLAQEGAGDIVLLDIPEVEDPTRGRSLDLAEASPILQTTGNLQGGSEMELLRGADVVIITAGIPRKPGMSRDDLVVTNQQIVHGIGKNIARFAPDAVVIVLSNPVDAMTYVVFKATGFPPQRIIGQSGVLDTARFRYFVSEALGVAPRDVCGLVLGGHGDAMVPLTRYTTVGGVPLTQLLDESKISALVERTRKGGGEIVQLLKTGSAYFAPGAALVEMTMAVLQDSKRVLPAVVYLQGEYGYRDFYLGLPAVLGASGVERILTIDLTSEEKSALEFSVNSVRSVLQVLKAV